VTVAAGPFVVAGPGARDIAASCLAWYICAMGEGYAKLIADQGYGDAVEAIISANPRPKPTNSTVPESANDALVAFMVFRTPEEVRHNLEPWKVAQTCSWPSSSPECHGRISKQRCVQSPTNKLRRAPGSAWCRRPNETPGRNWRHYLAFGGCEGRVGSVPTHPAMCRPIEIPTTPGNRSSEGVGRSRSFLNPVSPRLTPPLGGHSGPQPKGGKCAPR
jgi:hypothetical protein